MDRDTGAGGSVSQAIRFGLSRCCTLVRLNAP
ncbi:hypothetical protein Rrhod_2011 [Rhodococcus rhodnii LMG 5362]|uniref:Uncharacterized protein n=1 Tax=Rhodococcus rhodnii LMG 5362 TaxID=1273125 RepID=R7WRL1_9NOCA|nr:hypothetical protein Rrhod_2011 [Rhodococcus rhodnii LMG 5362]